MGHLQSMGNMTQVQILGIQNRFWTNIENRTRWYSKDNVRTFMACRTGSCILDDWRIFTLLLRIRRLRLVIGFCSVKSQQKRHCLVYGALKNEKKMKKKILIAYFLISGFVSGFLLLAFQITVLAQKERNCSSVPKYEFGKRIWYQIALGNKVLSAQEYISRSPRKKKPIRKHPGCQTYSR